MKQTLWTLLVTLVFTLTLQAQEDGKKKPKFGIKFSGFVKTDTFFDSRQTVDVRSGHFLLYPKNEDLNTEGNDINAKWNYNILSIQTRLAGDGCARICRSRRVSRSGR